MDFRMLKSGFATQGQTDPHVWSLVFILLYSNWSYFLDFSKAKVSYALTHTV